MARKIILAPYDPAWPSLFQQASDQIQAVLGANLIAIHHIGSTAIPGIAAKPTIDILVEVKNLSELDACNPKLAQAGYQAKGENGIPGRRYFQLLRGEEHLFHIHAFAAGQPDLARHLNFRNYLRTHPQAALAYQDLKGRLAAQFTHEPLAYTNGKSAFIQEIDQRASAWRAEQENEAAATPSGSI